MNLPFNATPFPDDELRYRIERALEEKCGVDLSQVQINVHEGDVLISGVVPGEKFDLITEEIIHCGARDIENLLRSEELEHQADLAEQISVAQEQDNEIKWN